MRRYSLAAICGITQADDDGNDSTFITRKQLMDLTDSLKGLPDVVEKLHKSLRTKGIETFDKITVDLYPRILDFVIKEKERSKQPPAMVTCYETVESATE